jgi:hypothetical protein
MNVNSLLRRLMGVSTVTKSRTGFLVALVAIIGVVGKEILVSVHVLNANGAHVCIGIALAGFFCWVIGWMREASRGGVVKGDAPVDGVVAEEHPLAFLGSLKYWGLIICLSAGAISCLTTWSRRAPRIVARARTVPTRTVTVTNVVTITNQAPPAVFPALWLQGVVVNGAKSSALINGCVLRVGEDISNAVLVAVEPEHAVVSFAGENHVLGMRQ